MAVDISGKENSLRIALSEGTIFLKKDTIKTIKENKIKKGDVYSSARLCAMHAVKQTPHILHYCHPIPIFEIRVDFETTENSITVKVRVKTEGKTGCEMEALHGVSSALLMIWDMVKSIEKDQNGQYPTTNIKNIIVVKKEKLSLSKN